MKRKQKIIFVAGARPNFMKIACLLKECRRQPAVRPVLVHSGQHYDAAMSDRFFKDLDIPAPQYCLGAGSGSHAEQTAKVLTAFERVCLKEKPAVVVVVGDVNSTVAACLAAKKLNIPVAHVEAGLRSFDRTMPEEVNRIVTDSISDFLFVTEASGVDNLRREGHAAYTIHFNTMIDTLLRLVGEAKTTVAGTRARLGLGQGEFALVTLHRPSNVDAPERLERLLDVLAELARDLWIVFPMHPRTRALVARLSSVVSAGGSPPCSLLLTAPLGYLEFIGLMAHASVVITDSGGIQEETTVLGIPCVTVRTTTERPITVATGTNRLVDPSDANALLEASRAAVSRGIMSPPPEVPLWDGRAGGRVAEALEAWANDRGWS